MPRSVKHGGKKVTRPSKNKKNASTAKKKALKRRKLAAKCARCIECGELLMLNPPKGVGRRRRRADSAFDQARNKTILKEWAKDKTLKQNLESMGLVYDANKAIPIRSGMDIASGDGEEMEVEEANARGSVKEQKDRLLKMKYGGSSVDGVKAARVIRALEREARMEEKRMSKGRRYRLLQQDIDFCVYMMQRHGEDYESMARDAKNLYQDTPKQIQRKIRIFKQSAEYQNLMASSSSQ